ncbi:MAG: SipW-dependent-type signal peptide-containing protein [Aristaeellaceae bacterium]
MKKNTRKLKKAALLLCSAVLLVCISIGATVAYLTSTDSVTNTFTVGNVKIELDESKASTDGTLTDNGTTRVKHNEYKLFPGHTYTKDPTIHVDADSEECWLFVKVENGIAGIEAAGAKGTIGTQMTNNGWTHLSGNIYYYNNKVSGMSSTLDIKVFDEFTIDGNVTNDQLKDYDSKKTEDEDKNVTYGGPTIIVTAYAIQADGFDTATAAWTAAGNSFSTTDTSAA